MYLAHFGFRERPFSNTPDPRFVYLGHRHEEALAHLLYGVHEHGGFVQLTGEIGTGKTTVCRLLLDRLPAGIDVALILNPVLTPEELLAALCDELGAAYEGPAPSRKALVDALYRHLLAAHAGQRRTVLIVDEAQNLTVEALEQLRLLTNLETDKQKLLQIILIGQPELTALLDRAELRQLAQRITARYHLQPFGEAETCAYVRHRLGLAGGSRDLFEPAALREVHRLAKGVPRLINVICDRALLGAYGQRRPRVDRHTVRTAAREVLGARTGTRARHAAVAAAVAVLVGVVTATALTTAVPALRARLAGVSPTAAGPAEGSADGDRVAAAPAAVSATAPATSGAPLPPALADVLAEVGPQADRAAAFASLFERWRLQPRAWSNPCEAAASIGLQCLGGGGGWAKLRRLDLPAALPFGGPEGSEQWAALVALEGNRATLAVGGRALTVSVDEIDVLWDGRFEALWQPPPIGADEVSPGSRGKPVVWLKQRLDALAGSAHPVASDLYDDRLRARVLAFQRDHALAADGIAGVETLARLGSLIDQRIPSLSRAGR